MNKVEPNRGKRKEKTKKCLEPCQMTVNKKREKKYNLMKKNDYMYI